ncbi:MAG: FAD-dependent oxidoreductase, partial [bacterium]|nr:FAD-dependent oxidoreductase [bacterium]
TLLLDTTLLKLVEAAGVELHLETRVVDVEKENGLLKAVVTEEGKKYQGGTFIDTSGSSGGISNCIRYGRGCVMCIHRCPIFGDRVSIATKAGARELTWLRPGGIPGRGGPAVALFKESLSASLQDRLRKEGAFSVPIPEELIDYSRMDNFKGLRGPREVSHVNLVDNGASAKCVGLGYFPLANLRKIPGFETAQFLHPMDAGRSNAVDMLSAAPRENSLRAKGFKNLFVAGEKSMISGVDEVLTSGVLAGNNAARAALGQQLVELPRSICVGDFIAFGGEMMETDAGRSQSCSTGHGTYFERMKELGFYSTKPAPIRKRIVDQGLGDIYSRKVV